MAELSMSEFMEVVDRAPLVSIDLVLRDANGQVLLGRRRNAPACGTWFFPGGRIKKGQSLGKAFSRICRSEADLKASLEEARFLGVYDHWYPNDNAAGLPGIDTQYVALAFELVNVPPDTRLAPDQHDAYRWWDLRSALACPDVHENTRRMLDDVSERAGTQGSDIELAQYDLVAQRRNTTNALLWQSPGLSLTAQAFLFLIALDANAETASRAVAAGLALVVALASVQLLLKHRAYEGDDAEWLSQFERRHRYQGFVNVSRKRDLPAKPSDSWVVEQGRTLVHFIVMRPASVVWLGLLLLFGAAAIYVLIDVLA